MSSNDSAEEIRKNDILTRYSSNLVESQDHEDTEEAWNLYHENDLKQFETRMVTASRNASGCLTEHLKKVGNLKREYENEFPSQKLYMEQTYLQSFDMEHIRWMNRCTFHTNVLSILTKDCESILYHITHSLITQRPFLIRRIEKIIIQIQSINYFLENDFQAYNTEDFFQPIYYHEPNCLYDFGGPPTRQEHTKGKKNSMNNQTSTKHVDSD